MATIKLFPLPGPSEAAYADPGQLPVVEGLIAAAATMKDAPAHTLDWFEWTPLVDERGALYQHVAFRIHTRFQKSGRTWVEGEKFSVCLDDLLDEMSQIHRLMMEARSL